MRNRNFNNDQSDDLIWIVVGSIVGLIFLGAALWFSSHTLLSLLAVKMANASLSGLDSLYQWLLLLQSPAPVIHFFIPESVFAGVGEIDELIANKHPRDINFSEFVALLDVTSIFLRLFCLPLLLISFAYIWFRSKAGRLTRRMNIFSLSKLAMEQFPQIRPAVIENLLKQSPDKGFYRREISPMRFAIKEELIKAYKTNFKDELLNEMIIPTFNKQHANDARYECIDDDYSKSISTLHNRCLLDHEKTRDVFVQQLGELWSGSDHLPPFVRGLYAAFIAFAVADKKAAFSLLDQFNRSWQPPTAKNTTASIDLNGVDEMIEKYESHDIIQNLLKRHAYVYTLMSSLLEAARKKGRLSSSLFLWVKVIDRTLWYTLSQEGGQCAWTEAAAVRSHKLAEVSVKGPLYRPYIETAVSEFESYLCHTEGWIPLAKDRPAGEA